MSKNGLIFGRALFVLVIIVAFGIIIINEKGGKLFISKAKNNINEYINENYNNIKEDIKIDSIKYKNRAFTAKIISKKNKNLFFNITYKDKRITDTYKEDYLEGKTFFTYLNKKIEDEISSRTKEENKVKEISTLDKYTDSVKEKLLKEENVINIKYYYIEKELIIDNWNEKTITDEIIKYININTTNNINPKYYNIIITDSKDITKSIEISNITEDFLNNNNKESIINNIINKNSSKELEDSNIKYKYLNETE